MSSSWHLRADRRAALSVALIAVVTAGVQLVAPVAAAAAQLAVVAVIAPPGEAPTSLIAELRGTPVSGARPESFSVKAGTQGLPSRATPILSDQLAAALVVDASTDAAGTLQTGLSGAANLLLQLPATTRTAVIADAGPPAVVAPLRTGRTEALTAISSIRAGGERNTVDAVKLALRQLPARNDGPRLVTLYTSASDAGGEPADVLAARFASSHAILAVVVSTGVPTGYWSRVATATGGVLSSAGPSTAMTAFDQVADALNARYLVTFTRPSQLPTGLSVTVETAAGTLTANALARPATSPRATTRAPSPTAGRSDSTDQGGARRLWLLTAGMTGAAVLAAMTMWLVARRARRREEAVGLDSLDGLMGAAPRRQPGPPTELPRPVQADERAHDRAAAAAVLSAAAAATRTPTQPPTGEPPAPRWADSSDPADAVDPAENGTPAKASDPAQTSDPANAVDPAETRTTGGFPAVSAAAAALVQAQRWARAARAGSGGTTEAALWGDTEAALWGDPQAASPGDPQAASPGDPQAASPGDPQAASPGDPQAASPGDPQAASPGDRGASPGDPTTASPGGPRTAPQADARVAAPGGTADATPVDRAASSTQGGGRFVVSAARTPGGLSAVSAAAAALVEAQHRARAAGLAARAAARASASSTAMPTSPPPVSPPPDDSKTE